MNCKQTQQLLDQYIDGDLSQVQLNDLHQHLNTCENCNSDFKSAQNLIARLKDIPVASAKPGYEDRVLGFLQQGNSHRAAKHSWFAAGFTSAIAASFAMWMVLSPVSLISKDPEAVNSINLVVQKHKKVDLVFNLPTALADATLTLELPDNVEIQGYPGQHHLSWKTSLAKGTNRLALPLVATSQQPGILVASLTKDGKTRVFRIKLNALAAESTYLEPEIKQPEFKQVDPFENALS